VPATGWRALLPWRDRFGRLSWLRIAALFFIIFPALLLGHAAWTEALGPEPLKAATHETGRMAVRLLLASLAVTPFGRILGFPKLFQLRRMLGLAALAWAAFHALLYVGDQNWVLWRVAVEIASRFYLVLGFTALVGLAVLGWTSTDAWMKRLGRRWKRLHRLVFPIAVLALLHAFIQSKADTSQAVLMAGLFVWLMGWRALPARFQSSLAAIAGFGRRDADRRGGARIRLVCRGHEPAGLAHRAGQSRPVLRPAPGGAGRAGRGGLRRPRRRPPPCPAPAPGVVPRGPRRSATWPHAPTASPSFPATASARKPRPRACVCWTPPPALRLRPQAHRIRLVLRNLRQIGRMMPEDGPGPAQDSDSVFLGAGRLAGRARTTSRSGAS
jgi:DMSO/TMAO reductase YedYZ heme-binding membrane subunit